MYIMVEAIVDFDYEAQEPDELTIRKGDILRNITKKPGGWWEGTLNEKRGMFPDNFVHILESEVVLRNKSKEKRICQAVFSYVPEHDDELRLNVGDMIEVLGEIEEGWWRGRLGEKEGVFPSNFVEDITMPTPQTNSKKLHLSKEDLTNLPIDIELTAHVPTLPPKPVKIICQAMFAYKAQNDDELSLKVGDLITLISKDGQDKGWWRGELRGRIGVFPDNFVNVIPISVDTTNSTNSQSAINMLTQSSPIAKKAERLPPQVAKINPQPIAAAKKDSTTTTTPPKTMGTPPPVSSIAAMQRKSLETKTDGVVVPPIPGKKPTIPMKKSPSLTGSGGILSGLKQKVMGGSSSGSHDSSHKTSNDSLDGIGSSRISRDDIMPLSYTASSGDEKQDEFDRVERSSMLSDPRANRAKAPGRRPPSMVIRDLEQPSLTNGNAENHVTSSSSSSSITTTPLQQIPDESETTTPECKPKPRDWEKHRAPWMDELKLNQAKKTSPLNPESGAARLKFSTERLNDMESDDCMSKSMSAAIRLRTPTPEGPVGGGAPIGGDVVQHTQKPGVMLRNRNSINMGGLQTTPIVRPQSIHGDSKTTITTPTLLATSTPTTTSSSSSTTTTAASPSMLRNLTPSPVLKPPTGVIIVDSHNRPSGDRKSIGETTASTTCSPSAGYVPIKQYNELEDKVRLLEVALEKQNQLFNSKLDEILQRVHNDVGDLRQQMKTIEKSVDKLAQCVTQV